MGKVNLDNKNILVTGAAGFIGSNLIKRIYREVPLASIIGIDNMNDYYDVRLKEFRLKELSEYKTFTFVKGNIADKKLIEEIFEKYRPSVVVNLAAQAGVRYSITNPDAYIESNLIGFYNILEACRHSYDAGREGVAHFVYASSSSVYGSNKKVPYSTEDKVDNPVSLYVEGVIRVMKKAPDRKTGKDGLPVPPYRVYNIGKGTPENLLDFVQILSEELIRAQILPKDYDFEAHKELVPMQPGDVPITYADTSALEKDFEYKPGTDLRKGLREFAEWYADFYK